MKKENNKVTNPLTEKLQALSAKSRAKELAPGTKVVGHISLESLDGKHTAKVYKRKGNAKRTDEIRMQNKLSNLKDKFNGKF